MGASFSFAVRRAVSASLLGLMTTSMMSCAVEPYCIDCRDGGVDTGVHGRDASGIDAQTVQFDARIDSGEGAGDAYAPPDGCTPGATELCNEFDDDCDGTLDEGFVLTTDPRNCGQCGRSCNAPHALGSCNASECRFEGCDVGFIDLDNDQSNGCEYRCTATGSDESRCDRRDDDCDGQIDETFDLMGDTNNCGACGRVCRFAHGASSCASGGCVLGACEDGFTNADGVATNGCEYRCVPAPGGAEICNRTDDDCDGIVDEGNPGGGASCGTDVGECVAGVRACVSGALVCQGSTAPVTETCNGSDDDCDGNTDENNPGGGAACGSDEGACNPGRQTCQGGTLACVGATLPATETCNGLDDDCNGMVDDNTAEAGRACGTTVGACEAGSTVCRSGAISCSGAVTPVIESCNGIDDDCDGMIDQLFDLANDARNCGMCGRACAIPNAVSRCSTGMCSIAGCNTGWVNANGMAADGCEYQCTASGNEICNGLDDDCDRRIDEGVTAPANFCNPNGVCASATATCMGNQGFRCNYAATYQMNETTCDTLDNDCDGRVDEMFPIGGACNNGGVGQCRGTGVFVCNGTTNFRCNAPAVGSPQTETCNAVDDDCDSRVDENASGTWTQFSTPAGNRWIMSYEASRPDATGTSAGLLSSGMVCSVSGRMPWTNVTNAQAEAYCARAGGRLCTGAEWQEACESSTNTCRWSYQNTCTTYSATTCNGNDYDSDPATAGDQDALSPTGSFAQCRSGWPTGSVYDLSGNAQEWVTATANGNPMRGGSYLDSSGGMTCQFAFEVANANFAVPSVGFRCCRTSAP